MATLLQQANDVADLLEGVVREIGREREEGETIDFIDAGGYRTFKVSGKTPLERLNYVVGAYAIEMSELISMPDGSDDFGVTDRTGVLRVLEDPLSPPTRIARRNLLAASALVFLMGATRQMPGRVPGFDFDLKGHPWIVGGLTVAVLLYQCASFVLYSRSDAARRALAEDELHDHVRVLKANVTRVDGALDILEACAAARSFAGNVTGWTMHAKGELARLEHEWSAARHRRRWDLWLPLPLVAAALLVLLVRSIW